MNVFLLLLLTMAPVIYAGDHDAPKMDALTEQHTQHHGQGDGAKEGFLAHTAEVAKDKLSDGVKEVGKLAHETGDFVKEKGVDLWTKLGDLSYAAMHKTGEMMKKAGEWFEQKSLKKENNPKDNAAISKEMKNN